MLRETPTEKLCTLPEFFWEHLTNSKNNHQKPTPSRYINNYGLGELFTFYQNISAVFFHPKIASQHRIKVRPSQHLTSIIIAFGSHIEIDTGQMQHCIHNNAIIFTSPKDFETTVSIQSPAEKTFALIHLPEHMLAYCKNPIDTSGNEYLTIPRNSATYRHAQFLFNNDCHPKLREQIILGKICEIINSLLQPLRPPKQIHYTTTSHANREQIIIAEKAEHILQTRYAEPPSLSQLAKHVGTNRNKLSESFKALYGKTVFEYCQQIRMSVAKRMLSKHPVSIAQVAESVGYEYPSNFTSAYKRHFGELPKASRRANSA